MVHQYWDEQGAEEPKVTPKCLSSWHGDDVLCLGDRLIKERWPHCWGQMAGKGKKNHCFFCFVMLIVELIWMLTMCAFLSI